MTHYGGLFLAEIGKRFGFTLRQMKYMMYEEVASLFVSSTLTPDIVENRIKSCLWYQEGEYFDVIYGPEAVAVRDKIFAKMNNDKVNDFRGLPAARGKARGRVKLVMSVKDIGKVANGDILVAVMTRPDYLVAMKKAAAIVTDEGGVTCHAAIVARELGIPCVIGTKIATAALQDGDEVEVNANHGVVTVIVRNEKIIP